MIQPFSQDMINLLSDMNVGMYQDSCQINPMVEVDDGYGNDIQTYPSTNNIVMGSVQPVVRIPGTPEGGASTLTVGEYTIKLPVGTQLPPVDQKCQIVVTSPRGNSGVYQVMNAYNDKQDRISDEVYCYKVK